MVGPEGVRKTIKGISNSRFPGLVLRDSKIIRDLHRATGAAGEGDDQSQRGTQLLEIYALEIQMYNETRNYKKLKVVARFA